MKDFKGDARIHLWLDTFPLEAQEKRQLLKKAGTPRRLLTDLEEIFRAVIKADKESVYNSMAASLVDGGKYFQKVLAALEKEKIQPVPLGDEEYPEALKKLSSPPLVLYAKGDISLLKTACFCVVGSRVTGDTAMKTGKAVAKELSKHFTVLTGTADGGDFAAVEGALAGSKKIVCVLAGGFDSLPKTNLLLDEVAKRGLLLAPHPAFTQVRPFSYESRNELLAALSSGVLIVSAGTKSGALITAKYAEKYQKPVFAFPYPPASPTGAGCNALIKNGAYLTENANDIFTRLGINAEESKKQRVELLANEKTVFELLERETELSVAAISEKTGLPAYLLGGVITALEVKGLIVKTGGTRVSIV